MYGHKQIMSCLAIVILVSIFNFYRSVMKRDKEHRVWREQQKTQLEQLELDLDRQRLHELDIVRQKADQRSSYLARWLEYDDHCCDLHALIFRPNDFNDKATIVRRSNSSSENEVEGVSKKNVKAVSRTPSVVNKKEIPSCEFRGPLSTSTEHHHVQDKVAGDLSTKIIYVAVFILLVSLGKAAYDWSKQFKELQQTKTLSEDEVLRRCSLQAYSLIKHKQQGQQQAAKATSAALEPFLKKTNAAALRPQLSLDSGADQTHEQHREFVRRISTNPQDYRNGSGLTSEPGTPVKPGKLLAGRPAPLLRRCSVPVFINQNSGTSRRPSMDSFSEDDSTTPGGGGEVKRRVRMIHRH